MMAVVSTDVLNASQQMVQELEGEKTTFTSKYCIYANQQEKQIFEMLFKKVK